MTPKTKPPALAGSANTARFTATIYRVGINRCVDVPPQVSRRFGAGTYVPVIAELKGWSRRTNLVPSGDGHHRLFLNSEARRAAHADTGDSVTITLRRDRNPDHVAVPDQLAEVLAEDAEVLSDFDSLTVAKRREIVRYFGKAKGAATRQKRARQIVDIVVREAGRRRDDDTAGG